MRGKLPELHVDCRLDLETRDRDAEVKGKTKAYADKAANAKSSDITVGDQVLVRREKRQILNTIQYNAIPCGKQDWQQCHCGGSRWDPILTLHVKRFIADDPLSTPGTPSASPD